MQVRDFNKLDRPPANNHGHPSHWHFDIRQLPNKRGELVFISNPYTREYHGEGRTPISNLSIKAQAEVIVPLLLEAFLTEFDGMAAMENNFGHPIAPHSWCTGDEKLAHAVSARCKQIGIRSDLCEVKISDAKKIQVSNECFVKWEKDVAHAMYLFDDWDSSEGEENVDMEGGCQMCHFTPSLERPLLPCDWCDTTFYCSREYMYVDRNIHQVTCVRALDWFVLPLGLLWRLVAESSRGLWTG